MNAVDQTRELLAGAAVIECTENTYIPNRAGLRLSLSKVGKTVADGEQLTGERAGEPFRLELPLRVKDIVAVSDDAVTYLLDQKLERLKGKTVTYRVIERKGARA